MALKILEVLVTKSGYTFDSVENGEDAFELIQSKNFDLIISDIGLPGISGNELAIKVRHWEKDNNRRQLPIIGLTGHAKETAYEESIASGFNDVFTKPVDVKILKRIVNQHVPKNEINAEEALFKLDDFPLFDIQYAMNQIKELPVLIQILKKSISKSVQEDIDIMSQAYAQGDWKKVADLAHKVKSGALYIGTRRLFYACQNLEQYYKAGHHLMLDELYKQLLTINAETIKTIKQWLKTYS